jgi:type II secretory pathway component PulC
VKIYDGYGYGYRVSVGNEDFFDKSGFYVGDEPVALAQNTLNADY